MFTQELLKLRCAMPTADKTQVTAIVAGLASLVWLLAWCCVVWVRKSPLKPDPWDEATETAVQSDEAVPVCHHCLTPVGAGQWFCVHCGNSVGPYNNWMPYVHIFSEGEVFRNGVLDKVRRTPLTVAGYILASLTNYLIFAPVYWFFLFRRWRSAADDSSQTGQAGTD